MSQVTVTNSKISRQSGLNGGCIHATQNSDAGIANTTIDSMEVDEKGAVVFALDSTIHISESTISNVEANQGAALFISYGSELELNMSSFSNLHAHTNGGILFLTANGQIHDTTFVNCTSISSGAGIFSDEGHVSIDNISMSDMNAKSGAAIYAINDADLDISNSQFLKCNVSSEGLIDLQNNSNLTMHTSIVDDYVGSAIVGDHADIELHDVRIQNGISLQDTQSVDCTQCYGFLVKESRFFNNTSTEGGAISAKTVAGNPILSRFVVESSQFINNTAGAAGAIYVSNHNMEIRHCDFESNKATDAEGGSLKLVCPDHSYCEYDVHDNNFTNNVAKIEGGAIKWDDVQPYNLTKNTYHENSAKYGGHIASFPIAI